MKFTNQLNELIENRVTCVLSNDTEIKYWLIDYDTDFKVLTLETADLDSTARCYLSISNVVGMVMYSKDNAYFSIINEDILSRASKTK
ncbi:hypothetical protein [Cohnella sp. WQ 127256]|uniref:hypothetical protein n=1 Tax=Cohnella sp. WQ 127256 TaxID=2938790 RepID=UPI002118860A|nr:hypothetical protein [Cohnella sp. WQ 127256]